MLVHDGIDGRGRKRKKGAQIKAMAVCPVHDIDRWRCTMECEPLRLEASRAANALTAYFRRMGMRQL